MSIFSSLVLLLPLPLLLLTSFMNPSSSAFKAAYIYGVCSQAKFTQGSAYESGVKSVLTSIVNAAMFSSYNNFTVLASSSSSSSSSQDIPIYGLFQCRGDLAAADCSHCVAQAVSQLGAICPDLTGGALQFDGCFVRYDDSQFLGEEDNTLVLRKCGPSDGFNSDVLTQRDAVLAYLGTSDGGYKMFRTTSSGNLQGMAQCVGDLTASECQDCLSNAIGRVKVECGPTQWGQIYLEKCYARYSEGGDHSPGGNSEGGDRSPGGNGENKNNNNNDSELQKTIAITIGLTAAGGSLLTISVAFAINWSKPGNGETGDEKIVKYEIKGGVQVSLDGPIDVRVEHADPKPSKCEQVDDCTCHTGHCTCNNGHFLPCNHGSLSICNY
ncbi:hypothetical protein QN277_004734 [Acacia crassicarpa]|uniref:Gnk2-homologous domain-containing protein n=1 Tax=Acacia crassicarpa TaxID=499986 RepID=A0AAE1J126_9FABA|nr:hypothetical protein QN277_004734 [Acacia crassicarpa]